MGDPVSPRRLHSAGGRAGADTDVTWQPSLDGDFTHVAEGQLW